MDELDPCARSAASTESGTTSLEGGSIGAAGSEVDSSERESCSCSVRSTIFSSCPEGIAACEEISRNATSICSRTLVDKIPTSAAVNPFVGTGGRTVVKGQTSAEVCNALSAAYPGL